MSLKYAVLGVLEACPMTGYELKRFFASSAQWVWSAPQSQIYPLLRRLEADGLIHGEEQARGERLRRSYSLTEHGAADLRSWVCEIHDDPNARDPLLLQSLFLDLAAPAAAEDILRAEMATLRKRIDQWAAHRARLLARDTPLLRERLRRRPEQDHERIARIKAHAFTYLIEAAQHRLDWCARLIEIVHGRGVAPYDDAVAADAGGR
ncbi:MAG: PadR family transcriptional regulator [Microbacterium sp.]